MAQTTSYGIGQYTYDSTFDYITLLGQSSSDTVHYIDYKSKSNMTYKDIVVDLPTSSQGQSLIKAGETYYVEITVPRDN